MKRFEVLQPTTIDEAVSLLGNYGDKAKVIAGGSDLIRTLRDEILPESPEYLINIKEIADLNYIREDAGGLKIGALATLHQIESDSAVKGKYKILADAARSVASPQIRNMGTISGNLVQDTRCWYYRSPNNRFFCFRKGGTICFAVPGDNRYNAILGGQVCFAVFPSDTGVALEALDASIVTNKRTMPVADLFEVLGNTLGADELITEVQVPEPKAGTKQAFLKFRLRKAIDFALSSVATAITVEAGTVTDARIVLGGVSPVPRRATDAEDVLKGNAISESVAEAAGVAAVKDAFALTQNGYLIQITKTLVGRAILA